MTVKTWILLSISTLFLLSGCANREIVLAAPDVHKAQENTWAKQTNVEENVDVSDLENNITMKETSIVESNVPIKMERIIFPVSEYKRLSRAGKGTVKGTIYLKDAYEKGFPGRSTRLYLNPVTSYSKQWYNESYLGDYKMEKADVRLFNYLRFTASDNEGHFAFYGVPTGKYYLIGTVNCGTECGYSTAKSIRIATQVSIVGNQIVEKNLSRLID